MLTPQFAKPDAKDGFGLGFSVGELDGPAAGRPRRRDLRLRHRAGRRCPTRSSASSSSPPATWPTPSIDAHRRRRPAADARREGTASRCRRSSEPKPLAAGARRRSSPAATQSEDRWFDLTESAGRLCLLPGPRRLPRPSCAPPGDDLDRRRRARLRPEDRARRATGSSSANDVYAQEPDRGPPAAPPAKWHGLIGEYGWDHNTLYILETDGKLHALIEWFFLVPADGGVARTSIAFPRPRPVPRREAGLHPRRDRPGDEGRGREGRLRAAARSTARTARRSSITPLRPLAELRKEALAATPPEEDGEFRKPELVDLADARPDDQARHPLRDRRTTS